MGLKVYEYKNCSTCKKALQFLQKKNIVFKALPIVEQPPTQKELKAMLETLKASGGSLKNLFNTSGVQYRELKVADKLKGGMTEAEAIRLLSQNGKLIKRPFVIGNGIGLVGFKEDQWKKSLS